ncbi:hypothetical protein PM8797T_15376 [Gimesia maris DSM 8797]|nr:hypothetical protein PM8797T_15376 [Gimesia maris DSM 8797]
MNTTRVQNIDGTNPDDLSRAEVESRRQAWDLIRFFRSHCPGLENTQLLATGSQVGVRETRHILGDYVLNGQDVLEGRKSQMESPSVPTRSISMIRRGPAAAWKAFTQIIMKFPIAVSCRDRSVISWWQDVPSRQTMKEPPRPA